MVIAVATMVHVIVRFSEARMLGLSTTASMSRTFRLLSSPIFWACTTDAVGFMALTTSKVGPVQDFGYMMAIGAGMVLCSVFLIVPTFGLLGSLDADPKKLWGQKELNRQLRLSVNLIEKYPRTVLYTVLFGCGLGILGMRHTQIETDFTKNFREDSEIVTAYRVVWKAGLVEREYAISFWMLLIDYRGNILKKCASSRSPSIRNCRIWRSQDSRKL